MPSSPDSIGLAGCLPLDQGSGLVGLLSIGGSERRFVGVPEIVAPERRSHNRRDSRGSRYLFGVSYEPFAQPRGRSAGARLITELTSGGWNEFRCAVAFAKLSGVAYLDAPLRAFASGGGRASIAVGVDHDGTSFEAVSQLLGAVGPGGEVLVVKHLGSPSPTFHPKAFLFTACDSHGQVDRALLISGSTNLTKGGLFTNYEFGSAWIPDLTDPRQAESLREAVDVLDAWTDTSTGLCVRLDPKSLVEMNARGWLPTEERIAAKRQPSGSSSSGSSSGGASAAPPAGLRKQPRPPNVPHSTSMGPPAVALPNAAAPARRIRARRVRARAVGGTGRGRATHDALVIDIATAKKTEVFLAKSALADDPVFFGHPFQGLTSPRRSTSSPQPERQPRPVVDLLLIGANGEQLSEYIEHEVKLWEYVKGTSANMDVRMIIPQALLRSLPSGCILEMRRSPVRASLDYRLEFLTPGSAKWTAARAVATKALPGGKRSYGWL